MSRNGGQRLWRGLLKLALLPAFFLGLAAYWLTGRTPGFAFTAMRHLYGPGNGGLNRLALAIVRRLRPAPPVVQIDGFLGRFSGAEVAAIVAQLDRDGYAPLGRSVPPELCRALTDFALGTPSLPMGGNRAELYAEDSANALRYDFSEAAILSCPTACRMAFDGTLAGIAGAYFRCRPIYDFSAMWWTTRFGERRYSEAAQQFHFDMDRLFFLKFFVYLTDVDAENGPHVFVAGSHREKPRPLREPVRFADADVAKLYPPESILSIRGPAGTIFAVDTCGLHKGMPVVVGHRLAFQIEFTISKFGQNYPPVSVPIASLREAGVAMPLDAGIYRVTVA